MRKAILVMLSMAALAVAGVAAWRFVPRAVRTPSGVDLGTRIAAGPLNLVIITLDTVPMRNRPGP